MDERFQTGVERFNEKDYFEAHEVLEDLWHEYRQDDRTFLQALIQLSAGLYHLDCGNHRGARSQLTKGLRKLEPYHPAHQGIDVRALAGDIHRCLEEMDRIENSTQTFDLNLFPSIRSSPQPHE